jgi:tRNA pseudouridine32 synthase/23S rRNA pseudouridine746 synthase
VINKLKVQSNRFIPFVESIDSIPLPERFTFPFYYDPHPLCLIAAKELQEYLINQRDWEHNFGIDPAKKGMVIGKMFGVLVVQNEAGQLGYLAAFSGKLAGGNQFEKFVPPVFDMLTDGGFFNEGMEGLDDLNQEVLRIEADPEFELAKQELELTTNTSAHDLEEFRAMMRAAKAERKIRRTALNETPDSPEKETTLSNITRESLSLKAEFRALSMQWKERLENVSEKSGKFSNEIARLKQERKLKSGALQKRLFDNYHFLTIDGEKRSLWDIFQDTVQKQSPAGAGECAAPKLLHYAFDNNLTPISMAEFWWGDSPKSEIRKHGNFYPACRGKCEPILAHMLKGIELDENPLLIVPSEGKELETIYEDEELLVINKPAEFLSVPGKTILDCVYHRMKQRYPEATGPLIVHRLDMSTSGLMLIAKSKQVHKILQRQFIERTIKKRYVALLDGIVNEDEGIIDLPLRTDIDDRPRQLVCLEWGKAAQTKWEVLERSNDQTRVHFYPITGRTHQLRVHAAHPDGLNFPIVGDDLYGKKSTRLHLHAEWIEFMHPRSRERMQVQVTADF